MYVHVSIYLILIFAILTVIYLGVDLFGFIFLRLCFLDGFPASSVVTDLPARAGEGLPRGGGWHLAERNSAQTPLCKNQRRLLWERGRAPCTGLQSSCFFKTLAWDHHAPHAVFMYGCAGSSLPHAGCCLVVVHRLPTAVASFAQALGARASAVATLGLSSCDLMALGLEGFNGCGTEDP